MWRPTIAPSFPNLPSTSKDAHSSQTDLPKSPGNTDGPLVENTVGVHSDTEENNPSQSPISRTTSSLTSLSSLPEWQTVGGRNFGGSPHIVAHPIPHSEIVSCVKAWVFKRGRKLVSGSNNKQSFKLAALPVLEDIEIYPNRENRPTNFQWIDWAEISDYEHETPVATFKVNFKSIASMAEHGIANDQKFSRSKTIDFVSRIRNHYGFKHGIWRWRMVRSVRSLLSIEVDRYTIINRRQC